MKILRMPEVKMATGYKSNTSIYQRIQLGIFPKRIRGGARSVGWLDYEVAEYVAALAKGYSNEKLKRVVRNLHIARFAVKGE